MTVSVTSEDSCTTGKQTDKNSTKFVCFLKCGENGDKGTIFYLQIYNYKLKFLH